MRSNWINAVMRRKATKNTRGPNAHELALTIYMGHIYEISATCSCKKEFHLDELKEMGYKLVNVDSDELKI